MSLKILCYKRTKLIFTRYILKIVKRTKVEVIAFARMTLQLIQRATLNSAS